MFLFYFFSTLTCSIRALETFRGVFVISRFFFVSVLHPLDKLVLTVCVINSKYMNVLFLLFCVCNRGTVPYCKMHDPTTHHLKKTAEVFRGLVTLGGQHRYSRAGITQYRTAALMVFSF